MSSESQRKSSQISQHIRNEWLTFPRKTFWGWRTKINQIFIALTWSIEVRRPGIHRLLNCLDQSRCDADIKSMNHNCKFERGKLILLIYMKVGSLTYEAKSVIPIRSLNFYIPSPSWWCSMSLQVIPFKSTSPLFQIRFP